MRRTAPLPVSMCIIQIAYSVFTKTPLNKCYKNNNTIIDPANRWNMLNAGATAQMKQQKEIGLFLWSIRAEYYTFLIKKKEKAEAHSQKQC